jgi:tetratricopeptide (TPR) repeat protein
MEGMLAETLADADLADAARKAADIALATNRKDPYALCAKGIVALRSRDWGSARRNLQLAVDAGRGGRARMLLGLTLYQAGELDAARPLFEQLVKEDPANVPALYNLALIAQNQNRYHDAREAYLGVLRLDPKNADARYNLALLAHGANVDGEARHDLSELAKIVPADDARLAALQKLLPN